LSKSEIVGTPTNARDKIVTSRAAGFDISPPLKIILSVSEIN